MTDKQPSKADQVVALRLARVDAKSSGVGGKTNEPASVRRSGKPERAPDRDSVPVKNGMGVVASPTPETKRGRPRIGETRDKPWEALGMSMRTWYRRQAEKRESSK